MKEVREDWRTIGIMEKYPQMTVQDRSGYSRLVEGRKWPDTRIKLQITNEERNRRSGRVKRYWEEQRRAEQVTHDPHGS